MGGLYQFLTGPGVWIAFAVFGLGLVARAFFLLGLSRMGDRLFYDHFRWGWSLRSIFHWLVPLGSRALRQQPLFGLAFWLFHFCLLLVPLFLGAHNILWEESWGWSLPSLPDGLADALTVVFMASAAVLFLRRLVRAEVRLLSGVGDYCLLLVTAAPFVTGFLAYRQIGPYEVMLLLHVLCGELMLVVIPFSKLGHMILFFFTRAFIGVDMGARREVEGRLGAKVW